GYTVLGQWYGEVKFTDRIFCAIGAKEYNTPYINKNDVRMTPNTFEGATIYGTAGGTDGAPEVRFGGGYIAKIKEKNADDFKWMSESAGAVGVERGVSVAGANLKYGDFTIGAAEYYSNDIINIFYAESKYGFPIGEKNRLSFSGQYSDQQSTGDNLLTGSSFSTNQWGIKSDLALGGTLLTLAYTDTANGANMRAPWSGYPGYTSVQVKDFNRASENAVMFKAAFDFSRVGVQGWSAYVLYVHGSGVKEPNYNENETDFNVQWTPKGGALRGLSFRLRYAYIEQRGGGDPNINDLRFIVNYDFPRPGE
ncbi:MAG: OprD family outer membrane porin, partial [Rhodanobacteraceae bacterium]